MTSWRSPDNPADEMAQLRDALDTQPVIEQAKGMLMLVRGWTAETAFAALRTISQRTNVKLHDVAAVVVAAGSHTEAATGGTETSVVVLDQLRQHVLGSAFDTPVQDSEPDAG
ncbi:ANTAR domain-containing protein [Amycolatopsis pretoriensis]|uniref:ANTAR domain-containing protein n=1 Tax=Amycolatopsis pretoriensis TaxID=218821 RepID=A0A1H5RFN7_9PSEU|nr:ANTAR domain-containing protein [Amycolatopsis pretoriensis]SEF37160.1 ANTAR domain-containing protein [Amycolatopsis pretoriensis]